MSTTTAPPAAPPTRPSQPFGAKRVLLLVFGSIGVLVGLALLAGGGAAVWGLSQRDGSGYFNTRTHGVSTTSYAFASDTLDMGPDAPGWFGENFATIRVQASARQPVFIGIGRADDVKRYLAQVPHTVVTDLDTDPFRVTSHPIGGSTRPAPPGQQVFWRVRASGLGTQTIKWPLEKGTWSAVAMNADGSRGVTVALRLGARVSALKWVAIGLLAGGGLVFALGGVLIYLGARTPRPAHNAPPLDQAGGQAAPPSPL
jgi:hypothetical protein